METILTVKEESMIAVADAVRDKAGVEGSLSFPNGMVDAINSISTGGAAAVAIDNKTIIEEDGVIRTVVGGYYADPVPAELLYETSENVNATFDIYNIYSSEQIFEMNGYFTLPNWTAIGASDRKMRATWEEHPYLDDPDWITTAFADVFWLDDTYRTLMVDNIQGSELIHSAAIDNETGVFGGVAPHIYEDPNSWSHIFISNFRLEIAGSDGGAVPIGSEFIPQEVWEGMDIAYGRSDEAYNRADEAHWRIDYLEQNGGGGSANVDNLTIINDGGVLRTAIGGYEYYTEAPSDLVWGLDREVLPEEDKFYIPELTGVLPDQMNPIQYVIQVTEWVDMVGENTWVSEASLVMGELMIASNPTSILGNVIYALNSNPYIKFKDGIDWENQCPCCITHIEIFDANSGGSEYVLSPIDAKFIPVDNETITIQDGRLVAAGGSGGGASDEVYVGTDEPSSDIKIWVDPDEEIEFATTEYVDNAISNIDLPSGGKDWNWVDHNSSENWVDVSSYSHIKVVGCIGESNQIISFDISTSHNNNFEEEHGSRYRNLVFYNESLYSIVFYNEGGTIQWDYWMGSVLGESTETSFEVLGYYYWG